MRQISTRAVLGLAIVVGLWGCGGGNSRTDSGMDDSGSSDSGPGDSGPGDSGPGDSGPGDSGPGDSGMDTGTADTGTADTGTADTGTADSGTDAGTDSGTDAGTGPAAPAAGEIVITEIMQNPSTLSDTLGEWFEIHNPSATDRYELMGCVITGLTDAGIMLDTSLVIAPGEYLTFASNIDPGFVPDVVWMSGSFALTNSSDSVRMSCPDGAGGSTLIDEVLYDGGPIFPDPNGASMQLDTSHTNATDNDGGYNWCDGMTNYNGDLGTPGAANEACPSHTIGFCRLQFPTAIDTTEGALVTTYGRVYVAGLTDVTTTGNDTSPLLVAMVGVGPHGSDPATDGTWTWTTAAPNAGFDPTAAGEPNNDEYTGDVTVQPAVGGTPTSYDYAYRFSGDRGASWTYCDTTDVGSPDGYIIADAGQMTARPAGPPPALLFTEYVEGTSNNKAIEITNIGTSIASLTSCTLNRYTNGSATVSATIPLSGILTGDALAAGASVVLCNPSILPATAGSCDALDSNVNHNGDDGWDLTCGTTLIDSFGQMNGTDPGSSWSGGGVDTANHTLRRNCGVTTGDTVIDDAFDPSVEWTQFPVDTFSDLGTYTCP
ncbi:MAG: hypothetical protein GW913_05760 [Myxococcales bacterium]|nr:hypothetical protein [Myxococcales bacterium]